MHHLLVFLGTQGPVPGDEPTLREGLDPDAVTPGTLGFLATFFVVVLTFFLIRDMVKRIRRVRYQQQVQEEADQHEGADSAGGTAGDRKGANDDGGPRIGSGPRRTDDDTDSASARHEPGGKHGPDSDYPDRHTRD